LHRVGAGAAAKPEIWLNGNGHRARRTATGEPFCARQGTVLFVNARLVILLAILVTLGLGAARLLTTTPGSGAPGGGRGQSAIAGTLATTNSSGRTGAYFLPSGFRGQSLPLLVGIHGTGASGSSIVALFRDAAERRHFLVVAPDSRFAPGGQATWEVGDHAGEVTEDFDHVRRCVEEVVAMEGVVVDRAHVLIAGHSGGGSTAPYVATNDETYAAFAVLHGGVLPGGLGGRTVRGWFSTGDADSMRTPLAVQEAADLLRARGLAIEYRVFHEGHEVREQEVAALVQWWLGS
jgi:poly(3-hydroxybutyrate) depolymerase